MNKTLRIILFGFFTWLIPFVVSFFFYSKEGKPLIDILFFKSIMVAVGAISGAVLLILYFKKITKNYLHESIIVGLSWLAINWLLDILILIPMSKMGFSAYFAQIGLSYLALPAMTIAVGYIAETKKR